MPITQSIPVPPVLWQVTFLRRKKSSNHFSIALEFSFFYVDGPNDQKSKELETRSIFILRKIADLERQEHLSCQCLARTRFCDAGCDLIFDYFVSIFNSSFMKCTLIFVCISLLAGSTSHAQQSTPASPIAPPPAGPSKPNTPAQAVVPVPVPIVPPKPNGPVQKSLVRITATSVEPDYKAPWNSGGIQRGVGAGFVISGNRILTNAHVVSNSRYLTVEREGDPNKYPATVQFVAHDCDLALITVSAPDFFKNMLPLKFGGIPALESTVSAYGYPIGGERMSVTTGIVSRVDFQLYTHSSIDQHLT